MTLSVNSFRSLHLSSELLLITNSLYSHVDRILSMIYNISKYHVEIINLIQNTSRTKQCLAASAVLNIF